MTTPTLEIAGLTVALPAGGDRHHAVADFSLRAHAGEVVCLLGESGSGKSVVAHAVMGLLPDALRVSGGSIRVQGQDVAQLSPEQRMKLRGAVTAMIFQEPMTALNPVMRCGAQIEEVLSIHGVGPASERQARVRELLARVRFADLARIARAFAHQLSGGQRQRVMIAGALAMRPALLICDEPTTALDVTTQADILQLIADIQRDTGTAILFITHDIAVAERIADRVVVMQQGQVVETGCPRQVLGAPQAAYTKMLVDAAPSLRPQRSPPNTPPNPNTPPVLTVRGLDNAYRHGGWLQRRRATVVADDVNLTVAAGETLGVVGESGSGKSSLARAIAQLIPYNRGDILLNGCPLKSGGRAVRSAVQMVFQDPYQSLNPRLRVIDSLIEGPINFGVSHEQAVARAHRLIAQVRLSEASLWRYPHEFSGGQRQRIGIARALACEPQLLIADEAVSALDVSVQKQILDLLEDLQAQLGLAMLFITHDLRVAARLCDRILVMQAGRVVECGTTRAVLQTPQHAYTRRLLAAARSERQEAQP